MESLLKGKSRSQKKEDEKQLNRQTHETKGRSKRQFDGREEKKIFLSGEGWQKMFTLHTQYAARL